MNPKWIAMMAEYGELDVQPIRDLFADQAGYATPRSHIFSSTIAILTGQPTSIDA